MPSLKRRSLEKKKEAPRDYAYHLLQIGDEVDLDKLQQSPSLLHSVRAWESSGAVWRKWRELTALLFRDHLLILELELRDGSVIHHVHQKPIPLRFISLPTSVYKPSKTGASRPKSISRSPSSETPPTLEKSSTHLNPISQSTLYKFTFQYFGDYELRLETIAACEELYSAVQLAKEARSRAEEQSRVFGFKTLNDQQLRAPVSDHTKKDAVVCDITCSTPLKTSTGRQLVAIGSSLGVWIGLPGDSKSFQRVLRVKNVTQCASLEENGLFLVLADNVLVAYDIKALLPTTVGSPEFPKVQEIAQKVTTFHVGSICDRTVLVYLKASSLSTTCTALEPRFTRGGAGDALPPNQDWFQKEREFYTADTMFGATFLRTKLVLYGEKGLSITSLQDLYLTLIPTMDDARYKKLRKRCTESHPIGLFNLGSSEFFLCYKGFGLWVNQFGEPSRPASMVEWERPATCAVWHAPYVLLLNSSFVEVRDASTGRLVQVIDGSDFLCTWDGSTAICNQSDEKEISGAGARVHIAYRNTVAGAATAPNAAVDGQIVAELTLLSQRLSEESQ